MDATQIEKLKALALAADQGTWEWEGRREDEDGYVYIPECSYLVGNICLSGSYENYAADCDYIAAACPATVLELIAENEHLRAELATRCRAEGGSTSENTATSRAGKTSDESAETRMNTGFAGDVKCSAPAAGTDKDAEHLVPRMDDFGAIWMVTRKEAAEIDAAIEAHTKARKPQE